jgi:hypothetical protein
MCLGEAGCRLLSALDGLLLPLRRTFLAEGLRAGAEAGVSGNDDSSCDTALSSACGWAGSVLGSTSMGVIAGRQQLVSACTTRGRQHPALVSMPCAHSKLYAAAIGFAAQASTQ